MSRSNACKTKAVKPLSKTAANASSVKMRCSNPLQLKQTQLSPTASARQQVLAVMHPLMIAVLLRSASCLAAPWALNTRRN